MVEFKDRLYELLSKFNINQTEFQKRTGIPKSSISMYLQGTRLPKQDKIFVIANEFNVNIQWLMGYEVPMRNEPDFSTPELDADISNDGEFKELYNKFIMLTDEQKKAVSVMIDTLYNSIQT